MNATAVWRAFLLALCACGGVCVAVNIVSGSMTVSEGLDFSIASTGVPYVARIEGVRPRSPAAAAGLSNGDLLRLRDLSPAVRYRLASGVYPREHLMLVTVHNGTVRTILYTSGPWVPIRWDLWIFYAGDVWMLLFAALIAWYRSERADARLLSLFLSLVAIQGLFQAGDWATHSALLDFAVGLAAFAANYCAYALLATYTTLFARPLSPLRQALVWLAYATVAAFVALVVVDEASYVFGHSKTFANIALYSGGSTIAEGAMASLSCLFPVLCMLATIQAAKGEERARVIWTSLTVGLFCVDECLSNIAWLVFPAFGRENGFSVEAQIGNVINFVAPLGMVYALFNRRLLDFGFVLNRAAVYSVVSIVILGIFVFAEWAFSQWFSSASHTTNLAMSAALALALGLSVRAIHSRVDRVLDAVFFRKRHEDEQAIRMLAHEAAYITDPQILLSRVIAVLEEHADSTSAQILLESGSRYGSVSENDPAIVRLHVTRKVLDLHDVQSAISGEFAYPMIARGRLVGVLVLGPKRNGESYAPDESDAIAQLAHDAGVSLDVLATKHETRDDALLEAIRELPQQIVNLLLEALPEPEKLAQ